MIRKLVSGGQTGVDRAALDVAIAFDVPHGGWCPRGRLAEDGPIHDQYLLAETESSDYAVRTEQNVIDSDGTWILAPGRLKGGSKLTQDLARRHHRPCQVTDIHHPDLEQVVTWIRTHHIEVLNVAGPRESGCPGIGQAARVVLADLLRQLMQLETKT